MHFLIEHFYIVVTNKSRLRQSTKKNKQRNIINNKAVNQTITRPQTDDLCFVSSVMGSPPTVVQENQFYHYCYQGYTVEEAVSSLFLQSDGVRVTGNTKVTIGLYE